MAEFAVVVVGAGVVGGAVAYEIARRGAAVGLVDARGVGLGATQAAAGMLVPYIEGCGAPVLKMCAASLSLYDEFVARVSRDSDHAIGYQRTGSLQVASSEASLAELSATAACAAADGVPCTRLDANQTRDAEPQLGPHVTGGLLIPSHGFVAAGGLASALVAAAVGRGAHLHAPVRVHRISRSTTAGCLDVQLDDTRLTARRVVLAAGAWSGGVDIEDVPSLPVRPVRGQLLQVAPDGPSLRRIVWGEGCYLVPTGPQSTLIGATMEEAGFDESVTVDGVRGLLNAASALVPGLAQGSFTTARVGLRPATRDGLPIIGLSKRLDGLVFATGHFRNGVLLAPLTARAAADLALEGREDPIFEAASPQRFGEF